MVKRLGSTIQMLMLLALCCGPSSAGEVFTWTDAQGNVHISDQPPESGTRVENVIPYSDTVKVKTPATTSIEDNSPASQALDRLNKRLKRLKERKTQIEIIIQENQTNIAAAEKDAATYHKRSGSYARRNVKLIERQLVVLNNNLTTYQSDLQYVKEDIAETEKLLEAKPQNMTADRP